MLKEDQFWTLVSLKLSGEATPDELATLDRLLEQNPQWNARLDAIGDYWTHASPSSGPPMKKGGLQRHIQRLNQIENLPSRGGGPRRVFLFALSIAASLAGFAFFFYHYQSPAKKPVSPLVCQNSISTKPGSKSRIQLPD